MDLTKEQAIQLQGIITKLKEGADPNSLNESDAQLLGGVLDSQEFKQTLGAAENKLKNKGLTENMISDEDARNIVSEVVTERN